MDSKPQRGGEQTGPDRQPALDALLAASRALVAVSARSIAETSEVTLPSFGC